MGGFRCRAVGREAALPAFLVQDGDEWRPGGWDEAGRRVDELAAGFLALGVGHGDRFALLAVERGEAAKVAHSERRCGRSSGAASTR